MLWGTQQGFQHADPGLCLQLGLHVFFGCYHNLFRLMTKCGALDNLLLKEHTHTFVNEGGRGVSAGRRMLAGTSGCHCGLEQH